jgi:hypothetical protein
MKTRNLNRALLVTIIFNLLMTYSIVFGNTVWDVTDDFSVDNGNPNGSWSYGWMDTDFTNFTLFESGDYTGGVPPESPIWYTESTSPKYGCVWKNTGPLVYDVATGQLSMHPGVGGYYTGGPWPDGGIPAVARWTALEGISGSCTIEGQFFPGNYDNTIQVAVRINNIQVWHGVDSGDFNLSTNVVPGDTIDFVVYGGYNSGGNTPLDATITPEPATLLLLGLGGLALLRKRRT